jgi:pimeloyl-ACP methyl ester carboxylesterase
MDFFDSDGVRIAYAVTGEGPPVLLIHGFASNGRVNWVDTGWVRTLVAGGHQVITLDNRGHGESEKLYDPAAYGAPVMAEDAARLLSHLNIAQADVMGYSMGARIAAYLTIANPAQVRRAVFAGLAANMIAGVAGAEEIAQALEAPAITDAPEGQPRNFRIFAEQTRSDRKALAACMRSSRQKITPAELSAISCPVLVVAGELDDIAGPTEPLIAAIPGAVGLTLSGRNHMNAVGDRTYKQAVLEFLSAP